MLLDLSDPQNFDGGKQQENVNNQIFCSVGTV